MIVLWSAPVEARQVSMENLEELAEWCGGFTSHTCVYLPLHNYENMDVDGTFVGLDRWIVRIEVGSDVRWHVLDKDRIVVDDDDRVHGEECDMGDDCSCVWSSL